MRGVVVQHAVVIVAHLRVRVFTAENDAVNLLAIIERNIFAQATIAEQDVVLQNFKLPLLRHVTLDHGEKLILQRDHFILKQHAGRVTHVER